MKFAGSVIYLVGACPDGPRRHTCPGTPPRGKTSKHPWYITPSKGGRITAKVTYSYCRRCDIPANTTLCPICLGPVIPVQVERSFWSFPPKRLGYAILVIFSIGVIYSLIQPMSSQLLLYCCMSFFGLIFMGGLAWWALSRGRMQEEAAALREGRSIVAGKEKPKPVPEMEKEGLASIRKKKKRSDGLGDGVVDTSGVEIITCESCGADVPEGRARCPECREVV